MKKVIFIQGIHNLQFRNKPLFKALHSLGYEVIFFPVFYAIHQTEKQLELLEKINTYLDESSPNEEFLLLGHSFGGILAYSLNDTSYQKVGKIITVGSPHSVTYKWFRNTLDKVPYREEVPVALQRSYGFFLDTLVPFVFTRKPSAQVHKNFFGTHNQFLQSKRFVRKIFSFEEALSDTDRN
jgi:pimeloyl-ACP methyl ester carboxylesterase